MRDTEARGFVHRRSFAMACATAALLAGCGITPSPAPSGSTFPTPTDYPFPSLDARACQASDLRAEPQGLWPAAGNVDLPVRFVNVSNSACGLLGYPTLAGIKSHRVEEPITVQHGGYFGDPGPPGILAPGGVGAAVLNVQTADACLAAQAGHHREYNVLRVGIPAGGSMDVRLPSPGFDTICGVWVSIFGIPAGS